MGIIKRLSFHEAQKIAAGEVVERPANIVKELIENALDAHATHIALYIQDGGRELIRCVDNGCGMSTEDVLMSVEHHATSKLATIDDLENLETFGFRGEALSSICSVSTMSIATQQHGAQEGIQISLEYGKLIKQEVASLAYGTDIIITNIFSNVPARRKFLKTRETEWRAIYTLVQAIALAHQHITFMLYHDKQGILTARATDSLKERIAQIFDHNFSSQFLECSRHEPKSNISISGGITHYQYQRYDRNQQFFFVNKRWIKNYKLGQAFTKGFQNIMPPGKHPAGVIFINLPQAEVDINVHPRKEEVSFLHPRLVELSIEKMIQQKLEDSTADRIQTYAKQQEAMHPVHSITTQQVDSALHTTPPALFSNVQSTRLEYAPISPSIPFQAPEIQQTFQPLKDVPFLERNNYTIIGQLLKTYLLLETAEGLLIIDQHAAHESVLYEQFSIASNKTDRIQLLFPEIVQLNASDRKLILGSIPELNRLGIVLEPTGETSVAIVETPLHLKNYNLTDLVYDLLAWIHESSTIDTDVWNNKISKKLYAMMACKAAVKAGDELSSLQIEELLKSLYKTKHRLTCPHGRPTTWVISQYDLEKTFKRKF